MDGFLFDGNTNAMRYWDGSDVPFYWSLALTFPLCDRWFASAPAQTYPNRMYLQAGTCQDLIATDVARAFSMPLPAGGTIWDKLNAHGISWHDYAWDLPDIALYPKVWDANKDKVKTFQQFLTDCRSGALSFRLDRQPGSRQVQRGEPRATSNSVRRTARRSSTRSWAVPRGRGPFCCSCMTEHGGYYDHVPPPRAIPPDDIQPDVEPAPGAPAAWKPVRLAISGLRDLTVPRDGTTSRV